MPYLLQRIQHLPRPLEEVFPFFADAANLQAITPEFLNFRIVSKLPITMEEGALIEYRLGLFGVPFSWKTRIDVWEPGVRFVDRQLSGPYRLWRHTHEFRAVDGGTEMVDTVEYELPLGPLGAVAHPLFVRRTLDRIFDHRHEAVARLLAG
jgi:hypothetical protein